MGFYIFISVLILLVCLLLALIVLIQNPKGGGLSSTFGGQGNQFLGVRKTTDFLEKGTWVLAGSLLLLSLISAYSIPRNVASDEGPSTELTVDDNALQLPALPGSTPAPEQQQPTQQPTGQPAQQQQQQQPAE